MSSENTISRSVLAKSGCWAFVLNPFVIETELPFEFASDCFIDKATEAQRQQIKDTLTKKIGEDAIWQPEHFYESEARPISNEKDAPTHYVRLPESEWRYYVVTTPDNGKTNINLHLASNISGTALEILGLHFFMNGGHGWRSGILQNHFERQPALAKRIGESELRDIAEVYCSYIELVGNSFESTTYPEISRAMNMYDSLSLLRDNSDFHVLGLFAIIEMLITHNPKLEDRGDSITHQMQSKIPLLSRRFEKPLDYSRYFGDTTEKKIWSALYAYRSAIAHGGVPDFHSGQLQILADADNAKAFLREVVKGLLRQALKEPQLYRDLRDC
jgi:hypothetical protein